MAANPELTGRTPAFFVAASALVGAAWTDCYGSPLGPAQRCAPFLAYDAIMHSGAVPT